MIWDFSKKSGKILDNIPVKLLISCIQANFKTFSHFSPLIQANFPDIFGSQKYLKLFVYVSKKS